MDSALLINRHSAQLQGFVDDLKEMHKANSKESS